MTAVVVVGSGAAGLAAALAAAAAGAQVTLLEGDAVLGGTTALSGGVAWLPGTGRDGGDASADAAAARRYLASVTAGDAAEDLLDTLVADASRVADLVEARSRVRWEALPYPDYHAERDGGALGGRSLEAQPLEQDEVRSAPAPIRAPVGWRLPLTHHELLRGRMDRQVLAHREVAGTFVMGGALVAGLVAGAVDAGVDLCAGVRARALRLDSQGAVTGVQTERGQVDGAVVLATGGFERDPGLRRTFLPPALTGFAGGPGARGDGLRMAVAAGAALGNMGEAWWCPTLRVPGELVDGEPLSRFVIAERARPGSLMVDGRGRRFVDEAQNYNDVGRSLLAFDAATFGYPRAPSWLVFDAAYRRRYPVGPVLRDDPDPDWFAVGDDWAALAGVIGVPPDALAATVAAFNDGAARGEDPEFGRGEFAYDRFLGDDDAPHPTLRPLGRPPFYAVRVEPGCLGTKGGPRTDADGRVLRWDGSAVAGLYAAGNAAASPLGLAYPGAGGTIGPALVFGTRAGEAAAM